MRKLFVPLFLLLAAPSVNAQEGNQRTQVASKAFAALIEDLQSPPSGGGEVIASQLLQNVTIGNELCFWSEQIALGDIETAPQRTRSARAAHKKRIAAIMVQFEQIIQAGHGAAYLLPQSRLNICLLDADRLSVKSRR